MQTIISCTYRYRAYTASVIILKGPIDQVILSYYGPSVIIDIGTFCKHPDEFKLRAVYATYIEARKKTMPSYYKEHVNYISVCNIHTTQKTFTLKFDGLV